MPVEKLQAKCKLWIVGTKNKRSTFLKVLAICYYCYRFISDQFHVGAFEFLLFDKPVQFRHHSFSMYPKFSEKLTFFTPWYSPRNYRRQKAIAFDIAIEEKIIGSKFLPPIIYLQFAMNLSLFC